MNRGLRSEGSGLTESTEITEKEVMEWSRRNRGNRRNGYHRDN